MGQLSDRVALVTGASRGLGRAIAYAIAQAGADVAVNYRAQGHAAQETCAIIEQLGCRSIAVQADVSVAQEVDQMITTVNQKLGEVSILVNNAGISLFQSIDTIQEADWDETLAVNLKSMFLTTQAVLKEMREQHWGRIINISSTAAQIGGVVGPHYAASKAGILGLTHAYAAQLAKEGITVNAIAPALIYTEMLTNNPGMRPDHIPVGRFGSPEDVADVAVMLACNGYMTGQTINVNGGMYLS